MSQTQTQEPAMFPDGRMDTTNAARYMGLSPKTLAMYRMSGKGPKFVKRGRVFYYRVDCDDWLKEGRVTSTAQARQLNGESSVPVATVATLPAAVPAQRRPPRTPKKPGPKRTR